MSEYIKKENVDTLVDELARAISDERCFMSKGRSTASIMQDILDLPTYSFPDSEPMKVVDNQVFIVSNYATDALQDTLDAYAENGYRLVNAILAKNKYSIDVMYLFFTKVESEKA